MYSIFRKEVNSFLNSLIAYIVIGVFLMATGLLIWVFPETNVLDYGYADLGVLFSFAPYVFMFLIPAITMRMFAEEKKTGTLELLYTRPISNWDIIMGKFFAGFFLVFFSILPTFLYYFSIYYLGNPVGNIDTAGVMGSYLGLLLLGGVFTAVGVMASSFTENQIVAFILAVFICFILYSGFSSLAAINPWASSAILVEQLGIVYHYSIMSKGLLDLRNIIYFLSIAGFMIAVTHFNLERRKW